MVADPTFSFHLSVYDKMGDPKLLFTSLEWNLNETWKIELYLNNVST